ncbi:hypothetical protein MPF_0942 [Methanohalophilus portucalensis FDF-1]|uniref:Uncharacterized protein n=1 Tax=Methanohalophilus portucalensis FDF-1 TaxID=523843 RepID=A0A1L9C6N1_9EURY|nr:hypothetical protein MPF_0942 [Methanohalophilus portucalensis FDF-1]
MSCFLNTLFTIISCEWLSVCSWFDALFRAKKCYIIYEQSTLYCSNSIIME